MNSGTVGGGSTPAVGDLDNDGVKEIVVGTKNRQLYVINADGAIRTGWPVTLPAEVVSAPAIGLVDGDAFADIVVTYKGTIDTGGSGGASAYRRNGTLIWSRPALDSSQDGLPDGVYSTPAIGNVDGVAGNEVVFGSFDFHVHVVRADGSELPGFPKFVRDSIWSSPALFDLDGDGKSEIIIGADTHREDPPYNTPDGGALHVLRYDGTEMPGWPRYTDQTTMSSPAVGDITEDGLPEIVVGTGVFYPGAVGRKVHAYRLDGTTVPGWPFSTDDQVFNSPALADLEGDGKLEVVISDQSANVYGLRGNGTQIFKMKPKDFFGNVVNATSPIIADVTGDSKSEILVGVNSEIAVISSTGVQLTHSTGFPAAGTSYYMETATSGAVVTDLDGDGFLEIVAGSGTPFPTATHGKVYVFAPGRAVAALPWPAFRQDPSLRRGVAPGSISGTPQPGRQFFTVTPCRALDTRNAAGPFGGPALTAGGQREFILAGVCGVPVSAKAVALNVTITGPTSFGDLRVYPSGGLGPNSSTINWGRAGQTRANNGTVPLGASTGGIYVWCVMPAGQSVHVILDVVGYYQ